MQHSMTVGADRDETFPRIGFPLASSKGREVVNVYEALSKFNTVGALEIELTYAAHATMYAYASSAG